MEVFPPKPDTDINVIYDTVDKLKELRPDFISVTYGAGGSTRGRTVEIADRIQNGFNIPALAHLTCIGATKDSIAAVLDELAEKGVKNIMALRGDLPPGEKEPFKDFRYAVDLVRFIKKNGDFCVGVAGYPEKHPEAATMEEDIKHLKEKTDAGADFITTQLFLDNEYFYSFREKVSGAGIKAPVLPGIMTATKPVHTEKMAGMCGVKIPERFRKATASAKPGTGICEETVNYTTGQINHLIKHGARGVHLYTMNKVKQNMEIYRKSDIPKARQ